MPSNADLQYRIMVNGVEETLTSIKALETRVKELSVAWKTCSTTVQAQTQALNDYRGAQATLVTALRPATQGMQNLSGVSANAGMALLNLNYVIRDSPYFFNNFAMGVLAVGNNLNPLIDSFSRLKKEALEASKSSGQMVTTFGLLKGAMVGGAGISIAFSVLVTAIQAFVFSMSKANRETKDLAESTGILATNIADVEKAVNRIRDSYREKKTQSLASDEVYSLKRLAELWKEYRTQQGIALGITTSGGVAPNAFQRGFASQEMARIQEEINLIVEGWVGTGEKVKDVTEKIKKQKQDYKDIRDIINEINESQIAQVKLSKDIGLQISRQQISDPFSQSNLREKFGMSGYQKVKNPMADMLKELDKNQKDLNMDLEIGKIFATQLGDALNEAFTKGELSLKKFIEALISAIAQMLILRAVTAFLTGGTSLAMSAIPIQPTSGTMPIGLNKSAIQVTGKIIADKNNFIANIRNADNYFAKNEEFIVIGR
jgi:hypothetical protein